MDIEKNKALKNKDKVKLLFVCLGNICRSPAAEEVFRTLAIERGLGDRFEVDSAGTYSGHRGQLPDKRMRVHAARRGYNLTHRARPVMESDFEEFDLIVAMDDANREDLRAIAPSPETREKIVLMAPYCRRPFGYDHVPDPYYEGSEGFEIVLDMLEDACSGLLESMV